MGNIVNNPNELKKLSIEQLDEQAELIRSFLVENISKTGGHIGSNLGIVELTLALHYHYDSPYDKFIFDVGHQSYVHKILTGRQDQFSTLRKYQGMSGFIKSNESEHDVWEAGHSSTSISAAAGFAFSRDLNGEDNTVIAIIGDGSLTNGMSLEALNHIVELNQNVIIIINDNEMSISSNVGFIDNILKDLQVSSDYKNTKLRIHRILKKLPLGKYVDNGLSKAKSRIKSSISSTQNFFNILGYNYIGPIDGHNISELIETFEDAKKFQGPKIIHVKTQKGRGYEPAISNNWHGVGPFDIATGEVKSKKVGVSYSALVANHVCHQMDSNDDIVVITPAMLGGSELSKISAKHPNRITDTGIAEEHALTFASGLAISGKKPFVAIYSTFLQRAYDQVFHDICRVNSNVVIGVDRAGLVGDDGDTHQGIYDVSFLSHMPNMTIVMGKDGPETIDLLNYALNDHVGPIAIRYPRGGSFNEELSTKECIKISPAKWPIIKESTSDYIITYGPLVQECVELFSDSDIGIINARFIKPIDIQLLESLENHNIVVVEEQAHFGNLHGIISQEFPKYNCSALNLGDNFVEHGDVNLVKKEFNLNGLEMKNEIIRILNGESKNR